MPYYSIFLMLFSSTSEFSARLPTNLASSTLKDLVFLTGSDMGLVSEFLTLFAGVLLIVFGIVYKWKRRRMESIAAKLPGPPALPVVGNLFQVIMTPKEFIVRGLKFCRDYPSPCRVWLGPNLYVVVHDPEDVQIVLSSPATAEKGYVYDFLKNSFGEGLITASSHKWKKHKRIISPVFSTKSLEHYVQIFGEKNRIMVQKLEKEVGKGTFNIHKYCEMLDLDIICQTSLGIDTEAQTKPNEEFTKAVYSSSRMMTVRALRVWLYPDYIYKKTELYRKEIRACEIIHGLAKDIIREKKEEMDRKLEENSENSDEIYEYYNADFKKRHNLLETLVRNTTGADALCEKDVLDEVVTMIIAGSETTALTNAFCLLMLAIHQDVQEKAYDEVYRVFGDSDRDATMEDLAQLTYLEQVIKETLRRWSLVFVFVRSCTEELQLTKHTIPAGCTVIIPTAVIHLKKEIYPKPYKFDPDRFSPENCAKRHKYSFIAFSGGPRSCIGAKFGMLSVKATVSSVLRRFSLETDVTMKELRMNIAIVTRCSSGYPVRLTERTPKPIS